MSNIEARLIYKQLKKTIYECLSKDKINKFRIYLGGSVAKNTSIDNTELDLYIKHKNPDRIYDSLLHLDFNYTTHTSITKYITVEYRDIVADLVPIPLGKNTVLPSYKHIPYVIKNLSKPTEVIKLKLWLKERYLYHSVITGGLSGYICELLLIKYTEFQNLFKNSKDVFEYLKVIVDPVASNRQLYKAISPDVLFRFYCLLSIECNSNILHLMNYKIIKISELSFRNYKVKDTIGILHKYNRLIEYIHLGTFYYIFYLNALEYIRTSTRFNQFIDLKQALNTNYVSVYKISCIHRIIMVNLTYLEQCAIELTGDELVHVKQVVGKMFPTNLEQIKQ